VYHARVSSVRARVSAVLVVLGSLSIAGLLLHRNDILYGYCLRLALPALAALPVLLAAIGVGHTLRVLACRLFARGATVQAGPLSEDLATGLPWFGSLCFLIACAGTSALAFHGWTLVCAALGFRRCLVALRTRVGSRLLFAAAWLAGLSALCALLIAQLPAISLDEVAYHLAVPRAWLIEGRVFAMPLHSHSYFPFGIESASLPLLATLGDRGAIAFHFVILASFVAALFALAELVRDTTSDSDESATALTWLVAAVATTPALVMVSGVGWIDAPFLALSITLCARMRRLLSVISAGGAVSRVALCECGVTVAAGALSKYTWAFVLLMVFAAALWCLRHARAQAMSVLACAVMGVLFGSIFFVRNLLWTGNPVAPFLRPDSPHVSGFNVASGAFELLANYLYDPIMVDESLGAAAPTLLLAFLVAQAELRAHPFLRALGFSATVASGLLMALGAASRLLLPFVTAAAATGAFALALALREQRALARLTSAALLGVATLQLLFIATMIAQYAPFSVVGRGEAAIVAEHRPLSPAIDWLNQHLPPDSKTLVLGIQESYWFTRRVRVGGNFDGPRVAAYLREPSAAALSSKLLRDGFTHVALYPKNLLLAAVEERGRRAESKTALDADTARVLRETLTQKAQQVGQGAGVTLLQLTR
jgi:hypothetical protein